MKVAYRNVKNWKPETKELLSKILAVTEDYQSQGYVS